MKIVQIKSLSLLMVELPERGYNPRVNETILMYNTDEFSIQYEDLNVKAELVCNILDVTERQARAYIFEKKDMPVKFIQRGNVVVKFKRSSEGIVKSFCYSAMESFYSIIMSDCGVYLNRNPMGGSPPTTASYIFYGSLEEELSAWEDAQSRTFDLERTYIFSTKKKRSETI